MPLIYSNQDFFGKFVFAYILLSFIQTSKSMLITGTIHTCNCTNNYWKCGKSKYLAYILECFGKRNIIKENIYNGVHF